MLEELGWVKLHRSLMSSATFNRLTAIQKLIAIYIILNANHQDGCWYDCYKGQEIHIKRGQLITSIQKIKSDWFGDDKLITERKIRTALEKLTKLGFLTKEATNSYTLITIENYDKYQGRDTKNVMGGDNEMSNESQTIGILLPSECQQTIIKKNEKNEKNKKECQEIFEHYCNVFSGLYSRLTLTAKRQGLISARLDHGFSVDQIKKAIDNIRTSSFHCGENDKNLFYASLEFLCKNDENLENWINHKATRGSNLATNKAYELYIKAKEEEEKESEVKKS